MESKTEKLKSLLKLLQNDTVRPEEIKKFLELVLGVIKKSKEDFQNLSTENLSKISSYIAQIEAENEKQAKLLDGKINTATGQMEAKIALLKGLMEEVKTLKPKDGENGLDGLNGENGKDGKDGSPDTRKEIVEKINTGKKDDTKIELKQIEGTEKFKKDISDWALGVLDQRTQFLINKIPSSTGTGISLTDLSAGTGISYDNTTGVITNSAPDQTVALTAGTNITSITGTYPNFTINAATQGGGSGITRTVETKALDFTAGSTASVDYVYFLTGTTTCTLPTAVGNTNRYTIKSVSGTTVVACNGAETIDGSATIGIQNEDSVDLVSNNTEWKVV